MQIVLNRIVFVFGLLLIQLHPAFSMPDNAVCDAAKSAAHADFMIKSRHGLSAGQLLHQSLFSRPLKTRRNGVAKQEIRPVVLLWKLALLNNNRLHDKMLVPDNDEDEEGFTLKKQPLTSTCSSCFFYQISPATYFINDLTNCIVRSIHILADKYIFLRVLRI